MDERPAGRVERPVNSLAEIQVSTESLDSLMGHIGRLGLEALDGWDAVATSVVEKPTPRSFAARGMQFEQLEEGLKTRTMIGQATGLLMAQEGLTSDDAFQKLVKVSQTSNVKLREIAQRYVDSWESATKGNAEHSG